MQTLSLSSYIRVIGIVSIVFGMCDSAFAALLLTEATATTPGAVAVQVSLVPDGSNALEGDLVFPKEYFSLQTIKLKDTVVTYWVTKPSLDQDYHEESPGGQSIIHFEGLIFGGFDGVRSPFYKGVHDGTVFTVEFIPRKAGRAAFTLSNAYVYKGDGVGSKEKNEELYYPIVVSQVPKALHLTNSSEQEISLPQSFSYDLFKSDATNNLWQLIFNENDTTKEIDRVEVFESSTSDPSGSKTDWQEITSPYRLADQDRSGFVHLKVIYQGGKTAYISIKPVGISERNIYICFILVISLFALISYAIIKKKTTFNFARK
jgi:hypothetical protein